MIKAILITAVVLISLGLLGIAYCIGVIWYITKYEEP